MELPLSLKIIKASRYIKNGDPLKDVLEEVEIEQAISMLAEVLKATHKLEKGNERLFKKKINKREQAK